MAKIKGTNVRNILNGTAAADTILGLGGNDDLFGLAGSDTLDGGTGADKMAGGKGNDTYIVDNVGDKAIELSGQGIDLVKSKVAFTLGVNVENLTLTGTAAINGTGNALGNTIKGNAGANRLTGRDGNDTLDGGAGADRLDGGTGDDTFIVDNSGDTITDSAGTDTVRSSITHTLDATIENLTLTGAGSIDGIGNGLQNIINGNLAGNSLDGGAGNDTINGAGGTDTIVGGFGSDTMFGGAGADEFQFNYMGAASASLNTNADQIMDFEKVAGAGGDTLHFDAIAVTVGLSTFTWVVSEVGPDSVFTLRGTIFDVTTVTVHNVTGLILGDDYSFG